MSRDIPVGFSDAVEAPTVDVFFAIELFFDTSTLRFWSGLGEVTLDWETYVGSGQMIQISSVDETLDVSAKGATLTLSGLPSDLLSLAIQEPYQGRKCKIYFGIKDNASQFLQQENDDYILTETGAYIDTNPASPVNVMAEIFSGYIDQMNIDEGAESSSIAVYVESRLIDLQRPRERRYTSESQKSRFPNDRGFEFVEDLQAKKFQWGR
jgi:hypothetical protein